jgi:hypothetical protein
MELGFELRALCLQGCIAYVERWIHCIVFIVVLHSYPYRTCPFIKKNISTVQVGASVK